MQGIFNLARTGAMHAPLVNRAFCGACRSGDGVVRYTSEHLERVTKICIDNIEAISGRAVSDADAIYKSSIKNMLTPDKCFLYQKDGKVVSVVGFLGHHVGSISFIATDSEERRKGYASLLIDRVCKELSIRGIEKVVASTSEVGGKKLLEANAFLARSGEGFPSGDHFVHFFRATAL